MYELSKSIHRRLSNPNFMTKYFVGHGIDIGGGNDSLEKYSYLFPNIKSVRNYDRPEGNAQKMSDVKDEFFDFLHSSHCLEHLDDPVEGLYNWIRILKVGGHLIATVPDEDLYEQGTFPSTWSDEHQWTFTIYKNNSWSPRSLNLTDLLANRTNNILIKKIELLDSTFNHRLPREDQTYTSPITESCIEFVIQKIGVNC